MVFFGFPKAFVFTNVSTEYDKFNYSTSDSPKIVLISFSVVLSLSLQKESRVDARFTFRDKSSMLIFSSSIS